jgi:alkylation response protein AidB-like acyl-CoA dehydrogenase
VPCAERPAGGVNLAREDAPDGDNARIGEASSPPISIDEAHERIERVARAIAAAHAPAVDREALWPEEALRALQESGVGGLVVPADKGGIGHGLLALAKACETLATECASTAICFGMHCVASAVIAAKATADQEERYLRPIAAGRHFTTLALSEPGSGSQFIFPASRLEERDAETFAITGEKAFVTNGGHADSYVVSTAVREAAPGEFSCVVLDADAPNLTWGPAWRGFGMRGNASRSLEMRETQIPRANLLGSMGDELWYVFNVIAPYFLTAMAGTYLGVAQAGFTEARSHLGRRTYASTGRAPANEAVVQHRLGALWAKLESARRLTYHAAAEGDAGGPDALPAILSSKAEVAQSAVEVVNDAMTLSGGIAYGDNAKLQRHLRDARAAHVMAPTTDMLRTWTGRVLLDLPLLSE